MTSDLTRWRVVWPSGLTEFVHAPTALEAAESMRNKRQTNYSRIHEPEEAAAMRVQFGGSAVQHDIIITKASPGE